MSFISSLGRSGTASIVLGGVPGVNLLPPSVALRQGDHRARRILGAAIAVVLVAVAVVGGLADNALRGAQAEVDSERGKSLALQTTEQEYAAAASASLAAAQITAVQQFVGKTDILWVPLLASLAQAVAPDAVINSTSSVGTVSWVQLPVIVVPLAPPAVATSSLVISFGALGSLQTIVARLLTVPGVLAVNPGSVQLTGVTYSTTLSLSLGNAALSNRFTGTPIQGAQ